MAKKTASFLSGLLKDSGWDNGLMMQKSPESKRRSRYRISGRELRKAAGYSSGR